MTVIGVDVYNYCTTGGLSKTLNAIATDSDHIPCVVIKGDDDSDRDHKEQDNSEDKHG